MMFLQCLTLPAIQMPLIPLDEVMRTQGFLNPLNQKQLALAMQRHQQNGEGVPEWHYTVATEDVESGLFKYRVSLQH
jgi:hypothetical protein